MQLCIKTREIMRELIKMRLKKRKQYSLTGILSIRAKIFVEWNCKTCTCACRVGCRHSKLPLYETANKSFINDTDLNAMEISMDWHYL